VGPQRCDSGICVPEERKVDEFMVSERAVGLDLDVSIGASSSLTQIASAIVLKEVRSL
jgi:hypothetical protein